MKDINEYTAEVFRRSEKRIKERKRNRSRVFAVCVPLVLIVSVCSALFLPVSSMRKKGENIANAENYPESDCPYIALEICFNEVSADSCEKVTDAANIAKIYGTMNSFFTDDSGDGGYQPTDGGSLATESNGLPYGSNNKGHTVIFTAKDGSKIEYRLIGNALINEKENRTVFLDNEEVAELMTALGISDK